MSRAVAVALAAVLAGACWSAPHPRAPGLDADPLAFLPADSAMVAHADVRRLRQSPPWQRVEAALVARIERPLLQLRVLCGFAPLATIRSITVGMRDDSPTDPTFLLVVRGFDREAFVRCTKSIVASEPTAATFDGDVIIMPGEAGDPPVVIAFADARTLVAGFGPGASPAVVRGAIRAGAPLRSAPAFRGRGADPAFARTAWVAVDGTAKALAGDVIPSGIDPRFVIASLELTRGLEGTLRVDLATPAAAAQALTRVRADVAALANEGFATRLDVAARAHDLVFTLGMTAAQVDALVDELLRWIGPAAPPEGGQAARGPASPQRRSGP